MKRVMMLFLLLMLAGTAFSQMNWYGKPQVAGRVQATSTWDTVWLNAERNDIWKGWISNGADTLIYCTNEDTTNSSYIYPSETESGVLLYGRYIKFKTSTDTTTIRYKFN